MIQLMPSLPLHLLLQQNPEQFILLVPAYPGFPGKKAIKQVSSMRVCMCVCVFIILTFLVSLKWLVTTSLLKTMQQQQQHTLELNYLKYTMSQKNGTATLLSVTLPNTNQFLKNFHQQTQQQISSKTLTKYPTTPYKCCYTTL